MTSKPVYIKGVNILLTGYELAKLLYSLNEVEFKVYMYIRLVSKGLSHGSININYAKATQMTSVLDILVRESVESLAKKGYIEMGSASRKQSTITILAIR